MGVSAYLSGLSKEDMENLRQTLCEQQSHKCFICGEDIDLDMHKVNIDHIHPLGGGGKDSPENFAITHERCNKSKQDSDLEVARAICHLDKILDKPRQKGEIASLAHVLEHFGGSKFNFSYKVEDNDLRYTFDELGDVEIYHAKILTDKLSGEKTAFIEVPIEYLYHDGVTNPRGINKSVNLLIKEFHEKRPQLQIALAKISDGKILLFDGQHKSVAQIMLGVKKLLIRLFIDPDADRLLKANEIAGSTLRQIAFDKTVLRQLHNQMYEERLLRYRKEHGLSEDDTSFSEAMFVNYFKGESARNYIIDSQKHQITYNQNNKLKDYINFEGKGTMLPLSGSTFEKTLLRTFILPKTVLSVPLNYLADEDKNPRALEQEQMIRICNIIAEEILINRYEKEIGTHKLEDRVQKGDSSIPLTHLIAARFFKEDIMAAWVKYLPRIIDYYLAATGKLKNDNGLLQDLLPEQVWINMRNFIINLRELPFWKDTNLAITVFAGKKASIYWDTVFKTGKTPDSTQVLIKALDLTEMIKADS
ncbi:MAG: HNH endonuclease signature motif containing protein [Synergistaceae bacterium]|nr:HNH endonuclease signature motif containing protein [Synergistaceae bacterium]